MKTIKTQSSNLIVVEITKDQDIMFDNVDGRILSYLRHENKNVEYIGRLSELTDKDCEEFIDKMYINYGTTNPIHFEYNNYNKPKKNTLHLACNTAKESFISLLQSNGVETNGKEYLIIKEKDE